VSRAAERSLEGDLMAGLTCPSVLARALAKGLRTEGR
jgi:hypothetical protein